MRERAEPFQNRLGRLFPEPPGADGEKRLAKTVTFQVTDACNLACTYCYQIKKDRHVMPFDVAKRFIDMILNGAAGADAYVNPENAPGLIIEFIGGEPFLEIDLIDEITDYFIQQLILQRHKWATRFRLSICSNGVLYADERVQRYIKKHLDRLSFSISIDGNKELHDACRVFPGGAGSYDIAIAGVKHYTEVLGGHMGSKMTLAPENVAHTFEAVRSLIEAGYTDINLNCVYEKGWTKEHARILYERLVPLADYMLENGLTETHSISMYNERFFRPKPEDEVTNWCGGTGHMISVDYKGDIYPCIRYMESSLGDVPPIIIGNVYDGIMQKQCEKDCVTMMKKVDRRTQSTDECFHCPIAEGCSWCSAYNYQELGSIDRRATYICDMHKARALANIYYWNRLYRKKGIDRVFPNHVPREWAVEIIGEEEYGKLTF